VQDSILFDEVDVGRYCRIRNAIIDKYVKIPPRTEIGFDLDKDRKTFTVTDSGIVVIAKGTDIKPPPLRVWMPGMERGGKVAS
jgi:glucose-1-phosphate adenylyltransferase